MKGLHLAQTAPLAFTPNSIGGAQRTTHQPVMTSAHGFAARSSVGPAFLSSAIRMSGARPQGGFRHALSMVSPERSFRLSQTVLCAARNADQFGSINEQTIPNWRNQVGEQLQQQGLSKEEIGSLIQTVPNAYILSHTPHEAAQTLTLLAPALRGSGANDAAQLLGLTESAPGIYTASVLNHPPINLDQMAQRFNDLGFSVVESSAYPLATGGRGDEESIGFTELTLLPKQASVTEGPNHKAIEEIFSGTAAGTIESDALNSLALTAGLPSRQIVMLRALNHYSSQLFSGQMGVDMQKALVNNPAAAKAISAHFEQRFDPAKQQERVETADTKASAKAAIDQVAQSSEFRALGQLLTLIEATDRTNLYQTDAAGESKGYVSFKVAPRRIPGLSLPTPRNEISVYSPTMEGVHLRFGEMSRGGLRWITPQNMFGREIQDFRTEVYGLAKAQQVKNSLVVPMGSKGGFLLKGPNAAKATQEQGIAAYKTLLNGMLDITDNRVGGEIVRPSQVVCHDAPDPYLVVAADKGTATFSDIGNSVSEAHGFWMADAFASGGQNGYDHKKMGITARGAWKSVERHFKEMGKDIEKEPFTTVGIGSMSGDVFGNGMLMSENTLLTAAISSRDIFIDPDPDPVDSYGERLRLFNMPRSSWKDYDEGLISNGGGVFPRNARAITITPEMKARFNIGESVLSGPELVSKLLKAPTDLLWNGAIGTYAKASGEGHDAAKDPSNDSIRVNANELGAKIVGEGGNLGFTQAARIEFALQSGRINTDFIDNVSGVDCSDHEVNTKILLQPLVESGQMSMEARNSLLESMTDEVAEAVLSNNYWQNLGLSLAQQDAKGSISSFVDQMNLLAETGHKRETYQLPSDKVLQERQAVGQGLTRPELAYIVSLSKNELTQTILDKGLTDQVDASRYLESALPETVVAEYPGAVHSHPLRNNIIATQISNAIINLMGPTYLNEVQKDSGKPLADVIDAVLVAYRQTGVLDKLPELEANESRISGSEMLAKLSGMQAQVDSETRRQL